MHLSFLWLYHPFNFGELLKIERTVEENGSEDL